MPDANDIFRGVGIEIELPDADSFLKVMETLTRIGVASRKEKHLYQSCHLLHKRGRYAILHFKELFQLDGKSTNFSADDLARRNKITALLEEWNLIKVKDRTKLEPQAPMSFIKILNFEEKKSWVLSPKYQVGTKRKDNETK